MRLKKAQKEKVLELIAAGAKTDEINSAGTGFNPPFTVSRQQIDQYRKTRRLELKAILRVDEKNALTTGLALKENRVLQLQRLASLMERDLLGGFLWTEEVKGVGAGAAAEVVDYDVFNAAEVTQYRGILDDIALEMGGRSKNLVDNSGDQVNAQRIYLGAQDIAKYFYA